MAGRIARGSEIERRLLERTIERDGCWIWTGALRSRTYCPYGAMKIGKGVIELTHRIAYRIYRGPIPQGMMVCHHCDTPCCVNPDHLFLGTRSDNMRDAYCKGRVAIWPEEKLTWEEVARIRELLRTTDLKHWEIAHRFKVSRGAITDIHNGRSWKREVA